MMDQLQSLWKVGNFMIKNKLDFKLINIALLVLIIFMLHKMSGLWINAVTALYKIIFPFLIAFAVSYALYPFVKWLENHKVPKAFSIFIVIILVASLFGVTLFMASPLLFEQLGSLFSSIISFIKEVSLKYDINFGPLQDTLSASFNDIIKTLGKYISDGAISFIGISLNYLSIAFIAIASSIYFLIDMDKIRNKVKVILIERPKMYNYIRELDYAMKNYLTGFIKIVFITVFEYSIAFLIVGHPNAILLGFIAAIASLIPYFGGMFTNLIAAITAFVISPSLFIRTIIAFVILSGLDSYVINPFVYGKTNEIHPIVVILSVFAGGKLWGITGIVISLPVAILIITTYHYFKDDLKERIEDRKIFRKN